jgi:polar amino acid transport system permease protein
LQWTLLLTAIGFVGGIVFGVVIALMRVAANPLLRYPATGWIALFQGTPLLMQLFLVYFGLPLLGLNVSAWVAVAIALTAHASAFLGEIWRGAIQAMPKGQTEAAHALGLHYVSRMKDVILPQAFRLSLPATIGFLVQLLKGTSLAAIVGFIELTRAGQIVANQTFQPLLIFGLVGAIYFALCWPLSLLGSRMEMRMARAHR